MVCPVEKPFIVIRINHSIRQHKWQQLIMHTTIKGSSHNCAHPAMNTWKLANKIHIEFHALNHQKHWETYYEKNDKWQMAKWQLEFKQIYTANNSRSNWGKNMHLLHWDKDHPKTKVGDQATFI